MKIYIKIFIKISICLFVFSLGNKLYANDQLPIHDETMYWGIYEGTLYISPTKQGYATNIDKKDMMLKDYDDIYVNLFCDWHNFSNSIKNVNILDDGNNRIKPQTMSFWFYDLVNCKRINGLSKIDTSVLEDCWKTFGNCASLEEIDFNGFDTSHIKYFSNMFENCKNIKYIDVGQFDTSNALSLSGMFENCLSLIEIDVTNFDTAKVTSLGSMFSGCASLVSLDLSNFDTKNVKTFDMLFNGCSNLEDIDISNFIFDNAKDSFFQMFQSCSKLKRLDLSHFNTENIENCIDMFKGCSSIKELDLSSFDTKNFKMLDGMFSGCNSLEKIIVGNRFFEYTNYKGKEMFLGCNNLVGQEGTKYDVDNIDSTYFRIDEGENNPGYLTLKSDISSNNVIMNKNESTKKSKVCFVIIITAFVIFYLAFFSIKRKRNSRNL